jgi:Rad3-related DNA helicase
MPIETMDMLWGKDFSRTNITIFISSTMRVARSFDYIRDRLRIEESAKCRTNQPSDRKDSRLLFRLRFRSEKPDYMMHANALIPKYR